MIRDFLTYDEMLGPTMTIVCEIFTPSCNVGSLTKLFQHWMTWRLLENGLKNRLNSRKSDATAQIGMLICIGYWLIPAWTLRYTRPENCESWRLFLWTDSPKCYQDAGSDFDFSFTQYLGHTMCLSKFSSLRGQGSYPMTFLSMYLDHSNAQSSSSSVPILTSLVPPFFFRCGFRWLVAFLFYVNTDTIPTMFRKSL